MILSNVEIISLLETGDIQIQPFEEKLVRPASVCLRLGRKCVSVEVSREIDVRDKSTYPRYEMIAAAADGGIFVPPKQMILAHTMEAIALSRQIAARIENLSGLARLGLQVALSNYISPGYGESGMSTLTLELFNTLEVPIRVYPEMRICHLVFTRLAVPCASSYDRQVGTYSRQTGPRGSHFFFEFTDATSP